MSGNIIKHSKIKNTGLLFEIITRRITLDIINGEKCKLTKLLKKYFSEGTELSKELSLYTILLKEKNTDFNKANILVEAVLNSKSKLNNQSIKNEKYDLVKDITSMGYDINEMLNINIVNYKEYANIYKLFRGIEEGLSTDAKFLMDYIDTKTKIIENVQSTSTPIMEDKVEENLLDNYNKQDHITKMLSYNLVIKEFNEKYRHVNENQKKLIKKYIHNILKFDKSFVPFIKEEMSNIVKNMENLISESTTDEIVKIKLEEVCSNLTTNKINEIKRLEDTHVNLLLNLYDLQDELGVK